AADGLPGGDGASRAYPDTAARQRRSERGATDPGAANPDAANPGAANPGAANADAAHAYPEPTPVPGTHAVLAITLSHTTATHAHARPCARRAAAFLRRC